MVVERALVKIIIAHGPFAHSPRHHRLSEVVRGIFSSYLSSSATRNATCRTIIFETQPPRNDARQLIYYKTTTRRSSIHNDFQTSLDLHTSRRFRSIRKLRRQIINVQLQGEPADRRVYRSGDDETVQRRVWGVHLPNCNSGAAKIMSWSPDASD